jgi:hypothetical protein
MTVERQPVPNTTQGAATSEVISISIKPFIWIYALYHGSMSLSIGT